MALPASQPVITQLTIDASGAAAGATQYDAAMAKAEEATNKLVAANDNLQKLLDQQGQQMKQVSAANDNVTRSWSGFVDGAENVGHSLQDTTANILNTVNHLKLLALGAYALSPAFRAAVNAALPAFFGMIGSAAASALRNVLSFTGPMLAFFAQITAPIAATVIAWKTLLAVWQQGADLLDKYANYNRKMFTPEGAQAALTEATKYQQGDLSADQLRYAAELGTRLDDANKKIDAFLKVNINVTNLALNLQSVWVNIVEVIAAAVTKLQTFLDSVPSWIPKAIGILAQGLPVVGPAIGLARSVGAFDGGGSGASASPDDAMKAARSTLAAAMAAKFTKGPLGGSFDARFWNFATGEPDKPEEPKSNAYDRAVEGIRNQIDLLKLEADGVSKTSQEYQELKVAHELNIAAMKAGIEATPEMRDEWKKLADQIADYTIKVNQAKVVQSETFKQQTMFMSPADQAAANAARQIDPTNWVAHLDDAGPKMAAFNQQLGEARDMSLGFLNTFDQGLMNGKSAVDSLHDAMKGLANTLLQMAEKNLVNAIFGPLFANGGTGGGGGGGGFFAALANLFKFQDGGSFVVPAGPGSMALPGFADGTDWTVPGSGPPDSKVTAFRVSPGERVTVTPPGRSTAQGGGSLQIEVATTVDKSGNIMSFVQNVAGQVAGQAVRLATPDIVKQAGSAVAAQNKNAPGYLRKGV